MGLARSGDCTYLRLRLRLQVLQPLGHVCRGAVERLHEWVG